MSPADSTASDPLGPLVEGSPAMIWGTGTVGRGDYYNPAWLAFTGLSLVEQRAQGWLPGVHPEDAERCERELQAHLAAPAPFTLEYRRRRHDGAYRALLERFAPLPRGPGSAGLVGTAEDIEEERLLARAKATFLSVTAHELRTLVGATRSLAEALHRAAQRTKPVKPAELAQLVAQVDRVEGVVRELGDAVRLEEGVVLMLSLREVDLRAVARDAMDALASRLPGRGERSHTFAVEAPSGEEGGGRVALPMLVMGDRRRLEQAVTNVLDNAVRYSPQGGPIDVTLATAGSEHRLAVADRGIGVPPGEIASLTRRFYRATNAPPQVPGVGMGLAVTREIVERHGGRLEIESQLGRGTRVTMVLPRVKGAGKKG